MLLFTAFVVAVSLTSGQAAPKPHSIDETETVVRATLAAQLKVEPGALTVTARAARTWPDAGLGCAPRKGVFEPAPTAGFAFTLTYEGRRYEFHTDAYGHVRRCPQGKPRPPRGSGAGARDTV